MAFDFRRTRSWRHSTQTVSDRVGVVQIVEDHDGNSYRAIYTVRFAESVYILHAFQRRILKRSRQESPICTDTNRCYSSIERTVWDGDQVLWEVRQAGSGEEKNPSGSPLTGQTGHVGCVYAGGLVGGRQAALTLQPDGSKPKAYQVRQVRRIITEHKLTTDEDE